MNRYDELIKNFHRDVNVEFWVIYTRVHMFVNLTFIIVEWYCRIVDKNVAFAIIFKSRTISRWLDSLNLVFALIVKFNAIDEKFNRFFFFFKLKKIISSRKKIFVFVVSFLIMLLKNIERLKKTISSTKKIFVYIISFSIIRLTKIERTTRKIIELWYLINDQLEYSFKLRNVINRLIIVWKTTLSCETLFFWKSIFFWTTSFAITSFFCFFFIFDDVCSFCTKFFHQIDVFHCDIFVENCFLIITIRFIIRRTFE